MAVGALEHGGTYHSVGQGLFHTGWIAWTADRPKFRYAYDCGSQGNRKGLENAIDGFIRELGPTEGLDLLVLSHLHADHVNGCRHLLKSLPRVNGRAPVGLAILPYLYPAERLIVAAASSEAGPPPPWYRRFVQDPAGYLLDHGVQRVIMVRAGGGETRRQLLPERTPQAEGPETENSAEPQIELATVPQRVHDAIGSEESEAHGIGRPANGQIDIKTSAGRVAIQGWSFLLFNHEVDSRRLGRFHRRVRRRFVRRTLAELLQDEDVLTGLRAEYNRLVGGRSLNLTSLAMMVCATTMNPHHLHFNVNLGPNANVYSEHCPRFLHGPMKSFGHLLTGDLPVGRLWKSVSARFGLSPPNPMVLTGIYQVPHHGSKHDWSDAQARIPCLAHVVSAGLENRYDHPGPDVVMAIMRTGLPLFWANEQCQVSYRCSIH